VEFCKGKISDLLQNRIDLSLLVITKGLSKKIGDENEEEGAKGKETNTYKSHSAHTQLAKKMKERDAASAP
jgi:DNA polymerase delta subunit 1